MNRTKTRQNKKKGMKTSLTLHNPNLNDLRFRQKLLSDERTMSYNHAWGGTIDFPKEQWKDWYDHWIRNPEGRRYYRYVKTASKEFVGEIAYHYDQETKCYMADVIIHADHRGKGYGSEALGLLCRIAKENGIKALYDDIAIDNPAIALFLKHGFIEEYRTDTIIMLRKDLEKEKGEPGHGIR